MKITNKNQIANQQISDGKLKKPRRNMNIKLCYRFYLTRFDIGVYQTKLVDPHKILGDFFVELAQGNFVHCSGNHSKVPSDPRLKDCDQVVVKGQIASHAEAFEEYCLNRL